MYYCTKHTYNFKDNCEECWKVRTQRAIDWEATMDKQGMFDVRDIDGMDWKEFVIYCEKESAKGDHYANE
jgi:hypothetical protein